MFIVTRPPLTRLVFSFRDLVLEGHACDCTYVDTLLFIAKSVDEHPDVSIPPAPTGWLGGRIGVEISFKFQALSATSTR